MTELAAMPDADLADFLLSMIDISAWTPPTIAKLREAARRLAAPKGEMKVAHIVDPPVSGTPAPQAAPGTDEREELARTMHDAYLEVCHRLGRPVKPEFNVPFHSLSDVEKDIDRHIAAEVLAAGYRKRP